jgi:DNA polymerase-3 subunit alpha
VQDFIRAARERGIAVGPGRGSAAGSVVSYCLRITNVDPIKYGLLFERFLNPERISMPDIDVDFADDKRDQVIQYVRERYGEDSVAQIITFGTLASRAVLKDVGRVLGIPLSTIDSITKQIPVELGKVRPLAEALETITDLHWVKESPDEKIRTLIDASIVLEGMNRNVSTHAAGVVIAPGNVSDYVPLYKTPQTEVMTQFSMKDLETVGLLKIDFLGLRTLTVIGETLELILKNHDVKLDLDTIPEDDQKTFELFSRADTVGVFQFESSGMRDWLRKLKPTCISDLVAMNALYRPGPMDMIGDFIARKHGQQKISYLSPKLEPILRETYGVIVYQEQVMRIASDIAGLSLAKADLMRRAMGKKDKALMAEVKKEFVEGAITHGTDRKLAGDIFDLIEKFASYGFNKSHSVAYSVVAYQTAFLKAHYPEEFMAATLSSEIGDTDRIVKLIEDCRKQGIKVLPPDVNHSGKGFTVKDAEIRFGLCAIKNVGESAIDTVLRTREEKGTFANIFDFCRRVDLRLVNKKCLESLVQAGALDSMGADRAKNFESIERAATFGQQYQSATSAGQSSLFEFQATERAGAVSYPSLTETHPWSEGEVLAREKNVLGFYVSGHPLMKYEVEVAEFSTVHLGEVADFKSGNIVRVCGIVTAVKKKIDRRNNTMAFVDFEDFGGKAECIVFADPYAKYQHLLQPDSMVMVVGKGEANGDLLKILVNEVYPLDKVREKFTKSIVLSIDVNSVHVNTIRELRDLMEKSQGNCPCLFSVLDSGSRKVFKAKISVNPAGDFVLEARRMLGTEGVRFVTTNGIQGTRG